jgi:hypothetical protein
MRRVSMDQAWMSSLSDYTDDYRLQLATLHQLHTPTHCHQNPVTASDEHFEPRGTGCMAVSSTTQTRTTTAKRPCFVLSCGTNDISLSGCVNVCYLRLQATKSQAHRGSRRVLVIAYA